MAQLQQFNDPSPLSKTVHSMAVHVHDQAQMLLMDISKGTHASSLESRLGCISGAILQLEDLLEAYRRINGNEPIYDPDSQPRKCSNCHHSTKS